MPSLYFFLLTAVFTGVWRLPLESEYAAELPLGPQRAVRDRTDPDPDHARCLGQGPAFDRPKDEGLAELRRQLVERRPKTVRDSGDV